MTGLMKRLLPAELLAASYRSAGLRGGLDVAHNLLVLGLVDDGSDHGRGVQRVSPMVLVIWTNASFRAAAN